MESNSSSSKGTITFPSGHLCKKCRKTFQTGQALGGHMTAHRSDRNVSLNVNGENKNWPTVPSPFLATVQLSPVDAPIPETEFNHAPATWVQPWSGEHGQGSMSTILGNPGGGEFGSKKNAVHLELELALDFYKAELAAEKVVDLKLKLGF